MCSTEAVASKAERRRGGLEIVDDHIGRIGNCSVQRFNWLLRSALNLVMASPCPLCQRSARTELCLDCQRRIQHCQLPEAQRYQNGPLPLFAWGQYAGGLKRAIAALKYENQPQLARPLAHGLAASWLETVSPGPQPIVIPVPMHPEKQHQRGFNQAVLLAKHFCEYTHLPYQEHGLERHRQTVAQFHLSVRDRAQNLAGAFCLGAGFRHQHPKRPVLLVDDIYTTGATVHAASHTLHHHGIQVCGVVVVARALVEGGRREG